MTNERIMAEVPYAIRGLKLESKSSDELNDMIQQHKKIDMFASQVIVEACYQVLLDRT